jgi:hypothetical protein
MARKGNRRESCVFEFDRIEVWGSELKRLFKDVLPKRLKRIFEAEPPDDLEHAREILFAHMMIERAEVVERLRKWLEGKRIAAYYGARMTVEEVRAGTGGSRSKSSLSRTPFEGHFDAYVPKDERRGVKARIIRIEIDGAEVLKGPGGVVDELPNVVREILDAWAYWLADSEFSPADECLLVSV